MAPAGGTVSHLEFVALIVHLVRVPYVGGKQDEDGARLGEHAVVR